MTWIESTGWSVQFSTLPVTKPKSVQFRPRCDAWLNTWSKYYSTPHPCLLCMCSKLIDALVNNYEISSPRQGSNCQCSSRYPFTSHSHPSSSLPNRPSNSIERMIIWFARETMSYTWSSTWSTLINIKYVGSSTVIWMLNRAVASGNPSLKQAVESWYHK